MPQGYRPELLTFKRCFLSLMYLHNETGNIFTHLLGALSFLAAWIVLRGSWLLGYPTADCWALACFFAGAVICMSSSSIFHTCYVHSRRVSAQMSKLDYTGIAALIGGSIVPVVHFTHYCNRTLATFYVAVNLAAALGTSAVTFSCGNGASLALLSCQSNK